MRTRWLHKPHSAVCRSRFAAGPAVLLLVLAGCGAGDNLAPEDIAATWDRLDYIAADGSATVTVEGDGALRVSDAVAGDNGGLLGPKTWRALEAALAGAELEALDPPYVAGPGEGLVLRVRDGAASGFRWSSVSGLPAPRTDLLTLFEQLRSEAAGPGSDPRVQLLPVGRLLHGLDAIGAPEELLVRDEDQMLALLRGRLRGSSLVLPEVDFDRQMVLAVFLGPRGNDAFDVAVDPFVTRTVDGYLRVTVCRYVRGAECPGTTGTGAFDLVRLPKSEAQLFLEWRTVALGCTEP